MNIEFKYPAVCLFFILGIATVFNTCQGNVCGGSLQANEGTLVYRDADSNTGRPCIWLLRLLTKSEFALRLNDIGSEASVGIFSIEQASSTFPIVQPRYIFNASFIDETVYPEGEVMVLILNEGQDRSFSISWSGLNASNNPATESVNYFDSNDGEILATDDGASIVAFVVNPQNAQGIDVGARVLGYEQDCANLAFSLFEVNAVGYLREVARTCGRPVGLQGIQAPLIAFVVKAIPSETHTIALEWSSKLPGATTLPTTTTSVPTTTSESTSSESSTANESTTASESTTTAEPDWAESVDECGGILVGTAGIISYRLNSTYRNFELCTWTIRTNYYANVTIQLTQDSLDVFNDYIHVASVASNGSVAHRFRIQRGDRTIYSVVGPVVLVTFSSDQSITYQGFQINFERDPSSDSSINNPSAAVRYQHFHLIPNNTVQEFNYPSGGDYYGPNELTTIVISRGIILPGQQNLQLVRRDIEETPECSADVLNIYVLQPRESTPVLLRERFCQEDYNTTLELAEYYAIVLVFRSDGANEFGGFNGLIWTS